MPVGSHNDAFKAHQLIKKLTSKESNPILAKTASSILLDFVKNMRQVNADRVLDTLPDDQTVYDDKKLSKALIAVDNLCGKCNDSHDDACFVNQSRRILIKAKTGADIGSKFDGQKSLNDLIKEAEHLIARIQEQQDQHEKAPEKKEDHPIRDSHKPDYQELLERYAALEEQNVFRGTLIDEINTTIAKVADGDFAAEMEVHEDEQLGRLASAFNLMLKTINRTMTNLDKLVAKRSAEMRMVMDTVPVGILSLDEKLRINPDYSKICEKILGMDTLTGRNFFDTLDLTNRRSEDRKKLEEFLDILAQQLLPEEDIIPLNPFPELELTKDYPADMLPENIKVDRWKKKRIHSSKWLRIKYHLIHRGDSEPCHFLVLLEDITRTKEMAAEVEKAEKDQLRFKAIAENPDLFCEFLEEGLQILTTGKEHVNTLKTSTEHNVLVNEIFRGVHTIKGTAAALNLEDISNQAADLENSLSSLRSAKKIEFQTIEATEKSLINLNNSFDELVEKTQELLGREIGKGAGDINLQVSANEIKHILIALTTMELDEQELQHIIRDISLLRTVSAPKGLARSLKILNGLGERLGKEIAFDLKGGETKIDCEMARELNTPLVHLFRNAFDHGIETAEERVIAHKPEQGKVNLSIQEDEKNVILTIIDDGRGIDPEKIKISAVKKGLITEKEAMTLSKQQCYELILQPGFSTAESVSDISGRGVGMDAVLHTIQEKLGGTITINSHVGKGSTFQISVPKTTYIRSKRAILH